MLSYISYIISSRIWAMAITKNVFDFDIMDWGWERNDRGVKPVWMTQPEASKSCYEFSKM